MNALFELIGFAAAVAGISALFIHGPAEWWRRGKDTWWLWVATEVKRTGRRR